MTLQFLSVTVYIQLPEMTAQVASTRLGVRNYEDFQALMKNGVSKKLSKLVLASVIAISRSRLSSLVSQSI